MTFQQITIKIDSKNADVLSDIFFAFNVLSVSIEDQFAGTDLEQPIFNEPGMEVEGLWQHSKLIILVDNNTNIPEIIKQAQNLCGVEFAYELAQVDNQDWVRLTQSQFQPIEVNHNLYIVPSWHDSPNPNAIAIRLDPGLAFGTGSHPTTFMCLKWIAENIQNNQNVLDYGCGSGILAITAKKFGAHTVTGIDIDEQAIESSIANAINNEVDINFVLPNKLIQQAYDVVIANILSNPLRILAPNLAQLTGKTLILSGILDSQSEELSEIYSRWFDVSIKNTLDGWVLLECNKICTHRF